MNARHAMAVVLGLALSPGAFAQSAVTVRDAWVREAPASRPTSAAYMVFENASGTDVAIVSGSTPAAKVLELHEMADENGRMRMRKVEKVVVPAKGSVTLKPGGLHVMLFELTGALEAGTTVPFTFKLADGSTVEVKAQVRASGGMH